jgi:hypothetical protein
VPWILTGAGLVGVGVLADTLPASARDHKLEATDFIPIGLYVLGAIAVGIGVF